MPNVRISGSGKSYTHRHLYAFAERQLKIAVQIEVDAQPFRLAAVIFSFMAFEAYLNFVGTELFPEIWKNERREFSKGEYGGPIGKFRWLADRANLDLQSEPNPLKAISELKDYRDRVAHALPISYEISDELDLNEEPEFMAFKSFLEDFSNDDVRQCLNDVRSVTDILHAKLVSIYGKTLIQNDAFEGMLDMAIWSKNLET